MGLSNAYGVVIGQKNSYYRDPPDSRYYHGNLTINTPAGIYKCAIDVDPKFMRQWYSSWLARILHFLRWNPPQAFATDSQGHPIKFSWQWKLQLAH